MVGEFPTGLWVTKGQMKELGGWFRKGEKPTWLWRPFVVTKEGTDKEGNPTEDHFTRFTVFPVWNVAQCRDLDESKLWKNPDAVERNNDPLKSCENIVAGYPKPPTLRRGEPSYAPVRDTVYMPTRKDFVGSEAYYSTLFHELGHSTGHKSRLNRPGVQSVERFGSASYSREELVAEFTSTLLCGEAGIALSVIDNQAAYLRGWLKALKDDPKLLAEAAAAAQKSADHILAR